MDRNNKGQFNKGHNLTPNGHRRTRGYKHTAEARERIRLSKLGKKRGAFPASWRKSMSEAVKKRHDAVVFGFKGGDANPSWIGGHSTKYGPGFTRFLKEQIKDRDGRECQLCFRDETEVRLAIHHINYNKMECSKDNLVTLCTGCNVKVNFGRDKWEAHFKSVLCQK